MKLFDLFLAWIRPTESPKEPHVTVKSSWWMDSKGTNVKTIGKDGWASNISYWEAMTDCDLVKANRSEEGVLQKQIHEGFVTFANVHTDKDHYRKLTT